MATTTLLKMAGGGICDHLGGGFHRYSVDELWHVPHFEKARSSASRARLHLIFGITSARHARQLQTPARLTCWMCCSRHNVSFSTQEIVVGL